VGKITECGLLIWNFGCGSDDNLMGITVGIEIMLVGNLWGFYPQKPKQKARNEKPHAKDHTL